ncbi:MAG: gamma-glutamyltransferase family protein, partial [Kiloniellales bacterium]
MRQTVQAMRGMVVAPHHLAAQAGLDVLREGGTAIEAMIAAAATISVVYPHMNGLGGDGFWLISTPDARPPLAINGVGAAAAKADEDLYRSKGLTAVPTRGPLAANSVAGTVSGWQAALEINAEWGGRLPLGRLLEAAITYARDGFPASDGQHRFTEAKRSELQEVPGWAAIFQPDGKAPATGARFKQPALAETLGRLAKAGLDDFYRGTLAKRIAADLERAGSPLSAGDLARQQAVRNEPLSVELGVGRVFNVTPPSQGLASLLILGIFDRLGCNEAEGFDHLHGLVEATKLAFLLRNSEITDPAYMTLDPRRVLQDSWLREATAKIDLRKAMPWGSGRPGGDTVWLGAIDREGRA